MQAVLDPPKRGGGGIEQQQHPFNKYTPPSKKNGIVGAYITNTIVLDPLYNYGLRYLIW